MKLNLFDYLTLYYSKSWNSCFHLKSRGLNVTDDIIIMIEVTSSYDDIIIMIEVTSSYDDIIIIISQ